MNPPILIVGNFLSGSRSYRLACEELSARLSARGWTVQTTSARPNRLARLVDMVWSTWRWRREYAVAVVDVFSGPAFLWAEATCWMLRRCRRPYVLVLRGGDLPTFARRQPRRVERLLGTASAVTAPSGYLVETMSPYGSGIFRVPNALDLGAYTCRIRRNVTPSLVWLRAFHRMYNPTLAIAVLAMLPGASLTMVGPDKGDGSMQASREEAAARGVSDRVRFVEGVGKADVPARLQAGDVFLNTTNVDNTPTSVLEAMACGLCVVSTNVGGIPYLLEDGKDALLVAPDDAEAMASAVRRLLTEPDLAEKLSRGARDKARALDWATVLPQWEALLGSVAGGAEGQPC